MTIYTLTTIIIGSAIVTSNASSIGQPINEYFDYNGPLLGDESCSLISVVMDESGSMATEQDFMKDAAIPSIVTQLKESGVDNIFVCIHGFGSRAHDPFGLDRGHFHGCTEGTSQGVVDSSIMDSWVTEGKYEDGWQAIHYAIRDLPSQINGKNLAQTCKTMGRNMILVTDEARHDNSCDGHLFQMEFKTGAYGAETSWELQDSQSNIVSQDRGYRPHEVVRVTKCLHKNDQYKLLFSESNVENGDGYIKVWYDDVLIADSPAKVQSHPTMPPPPNQAQAANLIEVDLGGGSSLSSKGNKKSGNRGFKGGSTSSGKQKGGSKGGSSAVSSKGNARKGGSKGTSAKGGKRQGRQLKTTNYFILENTEQQPKTTNYFTLENTQQKLLDTGYRLTAITILSMYGLRLDTLPLGVLSDGIVVEPDGNGSYTENKDFTSQLPLDLLDPNKMAQDYASISFETGGGAWLLHSLREGGQSVESFAQAFVDFNVQDFVEDAVATYAPSATPSTSPSTPSPSLQPSMAPSTSTPSNQPSGLPSFSPSTSQPSEQPTDQPTISTTEEHTEQGVFDGRIQTHEDDKDASRPIVGFATIGLLCAVGVAFVASRKRAQQKEKEEDEEKDDHSISMRHRASDTETESLDDTEEASSPLDVSMISDEDDDDPFGLAGLARCMEFASSFRWEKDQDHMIDLSELAGEYGGGGGGSSQGGYGRAFDLEYDEGEYE